MITRETALELLKQHLDNANLLKHMYATEAVMRSLARRFGQDEELWGLAGLLHDIDLGECTGDMARHSLRGGEILEQAGLPPELVYAVKCHNEYHGLERKSLLDKALYATDPTTGLIVAGALIRPEKQLAAVDVPFLVNRMNEKSFARGVNREQVKACSELGLELEDFLSTALLAMQEIHRDLGL